MRILATNLILAIGDIPMVPAKAKLDVTGRNFLQAVTVLSLNGKELRIEREGICEASGKWLQSPLSKAYWTAAQAYLDTHPTQSVQIVESVA